MTSRTFEQELEDRVKALEENPTPASVETRTAPKFTAIAGAGGTQRQGSDTQSQIADPLDGERLIAAAQQKYDLASEALDALELEHQLERTKAIERAKSEIAQLSQRVHRRLLSLDQEYERRKGPARKMMQLVSRLTGSVSV